MNADIATSPARGVRVTAERYAAGGEALARDGDGRIVFVRDAVPGDELEVVVGEQRSGWARGEILEVVSPAADRVDAPCPHRRAGCGGCDWQEVRVAAQLPYKVAIVADALRRTGRLPDAVVEIGASVPAEAYRTTMRVVGGADGRAALRRAGTDDPVPIDGCLVAHPALVELLARVTITPGVEVTFRVSHATGERTAIWDGRGDDVDGLPGDVGIGRRASLYEEVAGRRLRVSAGSFFQSGPAAAELVVDAVRRAAPELDSARRVLDAYAGVGLFAATVGAGAAHVVVVESNADAVADCRVNLARRSTSIVRGEFGRFRPRHDELLDVAIADPARSGIAKPGVGALAAVDAPVVVLVSCDPASLARDAHLLAGAGYAHVRSEVLDLFPHTHHVEVVTRFER